MPLFNEADRAWERGIRLQLRQELIDYCAPENDNSGIFSFGEMLAENEGAKAFNIEMSSSGDLKKARDASGKAADRVHVLAYQIKADSGVT